MTLSAEDIGKIAQLFTPLEKRIDKLETAMHTRFDKIDSHLDTLYKRDEDRQHEYEAIREQISRLENRVNDLEKKVA